MRRSQTMEQFSEIYLGRVHALSAAYSLLSSQGWQTVPLHAIVDEETKPFLAGDRPNILLDGPTVPLQPQAALALGMAIHELTTNAVKYGSLSVPEGNVAITWRVEQDHAGQHLILDWVEKDGPPVVPPTRRGFGMTLIERGLKQDMSAQVLIEFAEDGIKANLRAPLPAKTNATSGS
jgi:two-component sensor histidine kinase